MIITRNQIIGTGVLIVLLAAAFGAKLVWYPAVDEKMFLMDYQRLGREPAHIMVIRPTHFPNSRRSGAFMTQFPNKKGQYEPNSPLRGVGRNTPLAEVFANAYQCPASKVILPPVPPATNFDFLFTVTGHTLEKFRAAIKRQIGYTASWQQRDVEVLVIKVQGSAPPSAPPPGKIIITTRA
jgi:hypothetical protein